MISNQPNHVRDWLQSSRNKGMSLGLDNTRKALDLLGRPDREMKCLHIVGSNGKGSTCAQIAASLLTNGNSVGLFTSPHIARVEERIRINGKPISPTHFDRALRKIRDLELNLTFFEITFLASLVACKEANMEFMILETGLGGRLDATRTAEVIGCLITSISLEHSDILGDTIEKVASEKAAIARSGVPILIKDPGQESIRKSMLIEAPHAQFVEVHGTIKDQAKSLAKEFLTSLGLPYTPTDVRWPARMQQLNVEPIILLDAAHNPSGMRQAVKEFIPQLPEKWCLIFGSSPQTNMGSFLHPLKRMIEQNPPQKILLTKPQNGRYPGVEDLPIEGTWFSTPEKAIEFAQKMDVDLILVTGSLYLCGNILQILGFDSDEDLSLLAQPS